LDGQPETQFANCSSLKDLEMADGFYFVRLAQNEDLGRLGDSELIVQLMCEDHRRVGGVSLNLRHLI
jgi:hypothetical protein